MQATKRDTKKKKKAKKQHVPSSGEIYNAIFDNTSETFVAKILEASGEDDPQSVRNIKLLTKLFEHALLYDFKRAIDRTRLANVYENGSAANVQHSDFDGETIESYRDGKKLSDLLVLAQGDDSAIGSTSFLYSIVQFGNEKKRTSVLRTMPHLRSTALENLMQDAIVELRRTRRKQNASKSELWAVVRPDALPWMFGMVILTVAWVVGPFVWHAFSKILDKLHHDGQSLEDVKDSLINTMVFAAGMFLFDQAGWFLIKRAELNIMMRLRQKLLRRVLQQDMSYFDLRKRPLIIQRIDSDSETLTRKMIHVPRQISWSMGREIMSHVAILYMSSPALLAVALAPLPIIAVINFLLLKVRFRWKERARKYARIARFKTGELVNRIREVRNASMEMAEVEDYGAQEAFNAHIHMLSNAFEHFGCWYPFLVLMIASRCLASYGVASFVQEGSITVGRSIMCVSATAAIMNGMRQLIELLPEALEAAAPMHRIHATLNSKPRIEDEVNTLADAEKCPEGKRAASDVEGTIEFRNVTFAYPTEPSKTVLKGVSFTARSGEKIALVGASGSGKSTCMSLMMRYYDPQGGCILLDGKPLKEYDIRGVRRSVSIVAQENRAFSKTIRENILYGMTTAEKKSITEQELRHACELAGALAFIDDFPHGFETYTGEGGEKLSGGQRQRLALARAIIQKPKILLLDEATSALDNAVEKKVKIHIDRIGRENLSGCVIAIAHRLTTVCDYDRILVMDDGRIVETGTHEELLKIPIVREEDDTVVKGFYHHLWNESGVHDMSAERRLAALESENCMLKKCILEMKTMQRRRRSSSIDAKIERESKSTQV
eukprot:g3373.t1